ncbi:MAG: extracellular catalytic domain type 1 short-chain-length polyhydroxyalkanoate depolymerase [Myxococcota bacterium]
MSRTCAVLLLLLLGLGCASAGPEAGRAPLAPGLHEQKLSLRIGFTRRSYALYVPRGYDAARPMPLVVSVHGAFSTTRLHQERTGFNELADEQGFAVAYPRGMGLFDWLRHWNSGHCCGPARLTLLDDVEFLDAVIDDAMARVAIDPSRIYMAGFSNGGMLTHRFAAERSRRLAAAAVTAGTIGGKPDARTPVWRVPAPEAPVPVLMIHGRADAIVQYEGGRDRRSPTGRTWLSVTDSLRFWTRGNRCEPDPDRYAGGAIEVEVFRRCAGGASVQLYSIDRWGHVWPGPIAARRASPAPLAGFDAARVIWTFFESHRRALETASGGPAG